MTQMQITFDERNCECGHAAHVHDDGFGCTEPQCPCLAAWSCTVSGADEFRLAGMRELDW